MTDPDRVLELAAEIERRDSAAAESLELVTRLAREVDGVRVRAEALEATLVTAPGELAALDRSLAEVRDARAAAASALAAIEEEVGTPDPERPLSAEAERELQRARAVLVDLDARVTRLLGERATVAETESRARAEAAELGHEAESVAAEIRELPRVSRSGREPPEKGLAQLAAWGARVHAAMFVVRGQLEAERDRIIREANELGVSVLGEQLAGANVALVRQRLEEALRR